MIVATPDAYAPWVATEWQPTPHHRTGIRSSDTGAIPLRYPN
jgi:hypothetical protein